MIQTSVFLPPQALQWVMGDLEVRLVSGGEVRRLPFADAVAAAGNNWRLVLPVEAVTACAVRLPTQKARWLRQALPFAVEELLAEDVDGLHLAVGEPLEDGRHRVLAVRRAWLASWIDLATASGASPASLQVDADLLPLEGTRLFWLDGRWLLGGEGVSRLSVQDEDWSMLREACPHPWIGQASADRRSLEGIERWEGVQDSHVDLARWQGTELAQGDFEVRQPNRQWALWRPALGLVGLWAVLQCGFYLAQGWHLRHQGDAYAQANEALYRELFPQDTRLVNLRAQFDQHLADGNRPGQGKLLETLGQASGALLEDGAVVRIQQLDFSETRGDLALQVQAPGFDALERLRERLIGAGLAVQMGSASREGDSVSARLVIGG
ncbi:type II secretion system protein GspL [Metapseudomonas otitidis]|uniref:type II secretion system protein GspL n=1 Tax=Metapseudomonas otitidis TaxID=319939 RepID=UPI000D1B4163|nr:type II secretion system protein GspL [Pseudomonas otitidis]